MFSFWNKKRTIPIFQHRCFMKTIALVIFGYVQKKSALLLILNVIFVLIIIISFEIHSLSKNIPTNSFQHLILKFPKHLFIYRIWLFMYKKNQCHCRHWIFFLYLLQLEAIKRILHQKHPYKCIAIYNVKIPLKQLFSYST